MRSLLSLLPFLNWQCFALKSSIMTRPKKMTLQAKHVCQFQNWKVGSEQFHYIMEREPNTGIPGFLWDFNLTDRMNGFLYPWFYYSDYMLQINPTGWQYCLTAFNLNIMQTCNLKAVQTKISKWRAFPSLSIRMLYISRHRGFLISDTLFLTLNSSSYFILIKERSASWWH